MLDLLFHVQINDIFVPFNEDIDLAKIALSCRFALDLLCYKEMAFFTWHEHGMIATAGNLLLRTLTIKNPV